jgi:hypothetical protein
VNDLPGGPTGSLLLDLGALAAALVFGWKNHRRHARLAANVAATLSLASGVVVVGSAVAHLFFVTLIALRRSPFVYDFRLYSLLLLGGLLAAAGLLLVLGAPGVARGDPGSLRRTRNAALVLIAVNLPLIPVQGAAGPLAGLSAAVLVALLVAGRAK